jgi:tetratricopeptide (TPR) repeat protein
VTAFESVTRGRPDDVDVWFQMADALRVLERDAEAVAACNEVLRLQPARVDALYVKAGALARLGRHPEALAAYDAVLAGLGTPSPEAQRLPHNVTARVRLQQGASLAALGRSVDARAAFAEGFAAWDHGWENAAIHEMVARFVEARDAFLEVTPHKAQAWITLGFAFFSSGQADEARHAYETAIGLSPEHPDAWRGKADALLASGRREEAIAAYRECLRLRPGWPPIQQRLEELIIERGLSEPARPEPSPAAEAVRGERPRQPATTRRKADMGEFRCDLCHLPASMAAVGSTPTTVLVRVYLEPSSLQAESATVPVPAGQDRVAVHAIRGADAQALHALDPGMVPVYCPRCRKTYCLRHWTIDPAVSTRVRSCPEGHPRPRV